MAAPLAYLDACVDYGLVAVLRSHGVKVSSAVDEGTTGLDDEPQLLYAAERGWILVTHNEKHFPPLHVEFTRLGRSHGGIIVLPATPPLHRLAVRAAMMLTWIEGQSVHQSRLFKWGQLQELNERGHHPPGYDEQAVRIALGRPLI